MFIPAILYSVLFQTVLLRDWFFRVLIPESISNRFNESLSGGRQVLGDNILGDYFDIPSVLNTTEFRNSEGPECVCLYPPVEAFQNVA